MLLLFYLVAPAQDTLKTKWFSAHFQLTGIGQYHPKFSANYTGPNSFQTKESAALSVTSTIFLGSRLWKGAFLYFNPEVAGGAGLSKTLGVAGFPNGETFRVGSPLPKVYVARLFLRQYIALSKNKVYAEDDFNQVAAYIPESYFSFVIGRFCTADFFDNNSYAHDPRSQFMNWSLMNNAAWDYPANTRGYTYGVVLEYMRKNGGIRYGYTVVPKEANGSKMNFNLKVAGSHMLEGEASWTVKGNPGKLRAIAFITMANMGNYNLAAQMDTPDITATRKYSRFKYGFGINAEQTINDFVGLFVRGSWNDGANETWMFTEIDHSFSAGVSVTGTKWKRKNDNIGLAVVVNGISQQHRNYLSKGGLGFIIGDGKLNYAPEFITELYYNLELWKERIYVSPDYQFILNPAYNKDRGPAHVFACRVHVKF